MTKVWESLPATIFGYECLPIEELINGLSSLVGELAMQDQKDKAVHNYELPLLRRVQEVWEIGGFSQHDENYLKSWLLKKYIQYGCDRQAVAIARQIVGYKTQKEQNIGTITMEVFNS